MPVKPAAQILFFPQCSTSHTLKTTRSPCLVLVGSSKCYTRCVQPLTFLNMRTSSRSSLPWVLYSLKNSTLPNTKWNVSPRTRPLKELAWPVWSVLDIVQNIPSILVFHGRCIFFCSITRVVISKGGFAVEYFALREGQTKCGTLCFVI